MSLYTIANFIVELARPEHLTDRNIAERLSVDLDQLHTLADYLKRKGLLDPASVIETESGKHVTWELKEPGGFEANVRKAGNLGIDVDGPIVPVPPSWWTQDFVARGILRQGNGYFATHGIGGRDKRFSIAHIMTPAGDQRNAIAAIQHPYRASVSLFDGADQVHMHVLLPDLWRQWEPAETGTQRKPVTPMFTTGTKQNFTYEAKCPWCETPFGGGTTAVGDRLCPHCKKAIHVQAPSLFT